MCHSLTEKDNAKETRFWIKAINRTGFVWLRFQYSGAIQTLASVDNFEVNLERDRAKLIKYEIVYAIDQTMLLHLYFDQPSSISATTVRLTSFSR